MVRDTTVDRRCISCNTPLTGKLTQRYCTIKCKRNTKGKRRYHRKNQRIIKRMEKYKISAKEWRGRMRAEGRCTRCGSYNDGLDSGYLTCSNCRTEVHEI